MAETDELLAHLNRLVNVVRSAHLKRSLVSVESNPPLNFWRIIYGNLLDVAVLEWCKIFGAHSEPTHWKNVVAEPDAFRDGLLSELDIDEDGWKSH